MILLQMFYMMSAYLFDLRFGAAKFCFSKLMTGKSGPFASFRKNGFDMNAGHEIASKICNFVFEVVTFFQTGNTPVMRM